MSGLISQLALFTLRSSSPPYFCLVSATSASCNDTDVDVLPRWLAEAGGEIVRWKGDPAICQWFIEGGLAAIMAVFPSSNWAEIWRSLGLLGKIHSIRSACGVSSAQRQQQKQSRGGLCLTRNGKPQWVETLWQHLVENIRWTLSIKLEIDCGKFQKFGVTYFVVWRSCFLKFD